MNTLVVVNNTDITPYIDWNSYKMISNDVYKSWENANYVEHRIYTRSKVKGSFRVWLCGINDMDIDAFMELWNGATNNHITTLGVYVQTENRIKAINAYCDIKPDSHKEMINGNYFDVLTVEVTER